MNSLLQKFQAGLGLWLSCLLCIPNMAYSQYEGSYAYGKSFQKTMEIYRKKKYHDAIVEMNAFILKHPKSGGMLYNRGMAKIFLNDIKGAEQDFLLSLKTGYAPEGDFRDRMKWFVNKSYKVQKLADGYLDNPGELTEANNFKAVYTLADSLRGALRPERTCFDVTFYDLSFKVFPKSKSITGSVGIEFAVVEETDEIQIDLVKKLEITAIKFEGKELSFDRIHDAVFVDLGRTLSKGEHHKITVEYNGKPRIAPRPPWNGGFVWEKKKGKKWIGVACERLGASAWWPCKDHLSDKPDSMAITVIAPHKHKAVANGNLISVEPQEDKHNAFKWFVSYPINSYNVTFYIGNFENIKEKYQNDTTHYDVDYYILPHNKKKAEEYYSQTFVVLNVFEKLYGEHPYKRDGVGMVEAPYAGMEHQSAIAIGDDYRKTKRRGYTNEEFDYLLVHEIAYEWWGNTVAMEDMADAWISEGFATYSEHLFLEEHFGAQEYIDAVRQSMLGIQNIWPVVGNRDVNDNTFLGGDIYKKSAAMLNNLRCIVNNDSLFLSYIRDLYQHFKYTTVTTPEYTQFTNQYFGKDYSDFFKKFLFDAEPPILQYEYKTSKDSIAFSYMWKNVGEEFEMPFTLNIDGKASHRIAATANKQTVKFLGSEIFLPNERFPKEKLVAKNSLTYHWTQWVNVY